MSGLATARIARLPIDACRTGIASHPMYHKCEKCPCQSYCEIYPIVQENKKLLDISDEEFFAQVKKANEELQAERLQQNSKQTSKQNSFKTFFEKVADFFKL